MNNKITNLALFALSIIVVSCGGKEKSGADTTIPIDTIADFLADSTVMQKADSVDEKVPRYPTTESQLSHMKQSGNWDKYESGILPQMAEDVPSYCEKLLQNKYDHFIIVDKAKMKVFLYDRYGNVKKSYSIACAKNYGTKKKKGDSRTTEGFFNAEGVYDSREWLFTNDAGYTSPVKGQYGPRFIRLTTPFIGIHGTGSPGSIGRRCSHGCIRVTNDNILELVKYVEPGMPIIISPGPKDMAVNAKEGSDIPSVSTEPGQPRAVAGNYDPTQLNSRGSSVSNSNNNAQENADDSSVEEGNKTEAEEPKKEEPQPETAPSSPAQETTITVETSTAN